MTDPEQPKINLEPEPEELNDPTLLGEIIALNAMLSDQLPELSDRVDKLQKTAVTHQESKTRARKSIALVLIATFLGIIGSMVVTLGFVVPKCFFLRSPTTKAPGYCSVIPNYTRAIKQGKQQQQAFIKTQQDLTNEINTAKANSATNARIIDQLEKQLIVLDRRLGITPVPLPRH